MNTTVITYKAENVLGRTKAKFDRSAYFAIWIFARDRDFRLLFTHEQCFFYEESHKKELKKKLGAKRRDFF